MRRPLKKIELPKGKSFHRLGREVAYIILVNDLKRGKPSFKPTKGNIMMIVKKKNDNLIIIYVIAMAIAWVILKMIN